MAGTVDVVELKKEDSGRELIVVNTVNGEGLERELLIKAEPED